MSTFNAEEYWRDREVKKWVVYLATYRRNKLIDTDKKIVAARTERAARHTAIANSFINPTTSKCRLATPTDLGCTPSDSCVWCSGDGKNYSFKLLKEVKCEQCHGTGKREKAA